MDVEKDEQNERSCEGEAAKLLGKDRKGEHRSGGDRRRAEMRKICSADEPFPAEYPACIALFLRPYRFPCPSEDSPRRVVLSEQSSVGVNGSPLSIVPF
jgi:hypothetical protein